MLRFKSDNTYCENNVEESRTETENSEEARPLEILQAKVSAIQTQSGEQKPQGRHFFLSSRKTFFFSPQGRQKPLSKHFFSNNAYYSLRYAIV